MGDGARCPYPPHAVAVVRTPLARRASCHGSYEEDLMPRLHANGKLLRVYNTFSGNLLSDGSADALIGKDSERTTIKV
jgi:hypothetical protein